MNSSKKDYEVVSCSIRFIDEKNAELANFLKKNKQLSKSDF